MGVTQLNFPSKSFENVSFVLCSTDLESLGLGNNSQNLDIIYNLTYESFEISWCLLSLLVFCFTFSIMPSKIIHLLFIYCSTSQYHSGITLRILILHFELVLFGSFNSRHWKQVTMRLFLQSKIAYDEHLSH